MGGDGLFYDGMETEDVRPIMQWLKGAIQVKDWSNFIPDFPTLSDDYQIAFLRTIMEWHKCKYKEITRETLQQLIITPQNIDIGVYFVIRILLHLIDYQSVPTWNDLYLFVKEVSPHTNNHKILSLGISAELFDKCKGKISMHRYAPYYGYKAEENPPHYTIRIEKDYSSKICIQPTNKTTWQERLSLIKQHIPSRLYNAETKTWNTPPESYMAVIQFAKKYNANLIWAIDNLSEKSNKHIIEKAPVSYRFSYENCSLAFCEGRYWENKSKKLPCWWCYGTPCYENNICQHNDINKYTLYDFIYILGLQKVLRSEDTKGYVLPDGNYIKFMSVLNWFNRAQEHIYCKECGKILEPYKVSNYHARTITEFKCDNPTCNQKDIKIYLNHCFNGECQNIIDSRETKQCPNDKYICTSCGVCCSDYMFRNKTEMLDPFAPGFTNPHWELQEFYCPKCGSRLSPTTTSTYKCSHDGYEITIDITNGSRQYTKNLKACIKI